MPNDTLMDMMPALQRKGCEGCTVAGSIFPFTMAFQPIVDVQHRRIDAYEALVRGPTGEGAYHVLSRVNDENRYAFDQACRIRAIDLAARLGIQCRLNINFLPNAVYEGVGAGIRSWPAGSPTRLGQRGTETGFASRIMRLSTSMARATSPR